MQPLLLPTTPNRDTRERKPTMAVHVIGNISLVQVLAIQAQAQTALKEAMKNERSKRWGQVIINYTTLLKVLSRRRFPGDWTPPSWYSLLMYETHYHLGLALQRLNDHEGALKHYNHAIVAISIPKSGCAFGKCTTNSCLHTPLYAKRAFAHIKHAADFKNALKDAEKAVVLDSKNPNVYCIRAMVQNTMGERKQALDDLQLALTLDSNNVCALVLRGAIDKPLVDELSIYLGGKESKPNTDHIKAALLKSDAQNFLDVTDFNHPRILDFYDRFLYSLNVPHTVCHYHLILLPSKFRNLIACTQRPNTAKSTWTDKGPIDSKRVPAGLKIKATASTFNPCTKSHKDGGQTIRAFRAGTASQFTETVSATERRIAYGHAVRQVRRARSAPPVRLWTPTDSTYDSSSSTKSVYTLNTSRSSRRPMSAVTTSPTQLSYSTFNRNQDRGISKNASSLTSIRVMEKVNVKYAPRMYVKPWSGDRIPPADKEEKVSSFISTKPFLGVGPYR